MQAKNESNNKGGDGGQVFIFAKKIAGKGLIATDGGDGDIAGNGGKVHIVTEQNNYKGEISAKGGKSNIKDKWWENTLIQLIALISAIIGIIGFILNII